MARPRKQGLTYFPFDVDFFQDEKIVAIAGEFGLKGEIAVVKLLCAVYHNGYFILWSEMLRAKMLHQLPGVSADLLDQIVLRLVRWGFFDKSLFDSARILTSAGIQRRYFQATSKRLLDPDLPYLIGFPTPKPRSAVVSSAETPVSSAETTQIKVNKIKLKTLTSKKEPPSPPPGGEESDFSLAPPSAEELLNSPRWCASMMKSFGFDATRLRAAADAFLLHCDREEKQHADIRDARSHFSRWCARRIAAGLPLDGEPAPAALPQSSRISPAEASREAAREAERRSRSEEWERRQRSSLSPDDYIRSLGFDPAETTLAEALAASRSRESRD